MIFNLTFGYFVSADFFVFNYSVLYELMIFSRWDAFIMNFLQAALPFLVGCNYTFLDQIPEL